MWRVVTSTIATLTLASSAAFAQQPCTTDASRVVAEVYRHTLERGPDAGSQRWAQQLANGQITVRELVRRVASSQEYQQRFGQTESGEGQPYERAVARLYRHILGRQPDAGGQNYWARQAQQRGFAFVVDEFVNSEEYTRSFGDWAVPGSGGLRFCADGSSVNESSELVPRFRGMDRNNDGVITRSEWNGNAIAFNNQDWNNDGVLSGDEVRPGGRREANQRQSDFDFDALDVNNNNRIERREWQARLDRFNALDTNGDNVLSRAELNRAGGGGGVGTSGRFVNVGGDRQWVDTGINVLAGQTITISADGRVRLARDATDFVTAAGADNRIGDSTMPSAPVGGLIARFGTSAPVFVGQNRTLRVTRTGRLFLGVNDSYFEDNTGQFNAPVDIR